MAVLIDSSLWVDYFRAKTPALIRQQVVKFVDSAEAALCEPVRFEILRAARRSERKVIEETFETLPFLSTPNAFWEDATELGQKCTDAGFQPPAMDLIIAAVSLAHNVELATFDPHFEEIAKISSLKLLLLKRG